MKNTRLALLTLAAAAVVATALPSNAHAQDYRIAVVPAEIDGVDDQEWEDIVEESAYLVEDFGGFEVYRYYQLEEVLDDRTARHVNRCDMDTECYIEELFEETFDYVLAVSVVDVGDEIEVYYQMVDIQLGMLASEQWAYMPTATDFPYLLVPCHESLKVTPEWVDEGPIEVDVEIDGTPDEVVTPDPIVEVEPEPEPRRQRRQRRSGGGGLSMPEYAMAGGGALFVGGILMGFSADATQQEIQAEPHDAASLQALQDEGAQQQLISNAMLGLGGVAAAAGAVLYFTGGGADGGARAQILVDPARRWVGIGGQF